MYRYNFTISRVDSAGKVIEAVYSVSASEVKTPLQALVDVVRVLQTQIDIEGEKFHMVGLDLSEAMGEGTVVTTGKVIPWGDKAHASGLDHAPLIPLPRREKGATYRPQTLADLPTFSKDELRLIREDDPASIRMQELGDPEPPQGCICNAVSNPPCGFCESSGMEQENLRDV